MIEYKKVMCEREQALTTKQVADLEGLSEKTVERMCRRGEIPAYKIGRQWRIEPDYRNQLKERSAKD
jgi:excisionase family DNA binding protein